jgi:predicted NAD/FAD-binding protein
MISIAPERKPRLAVIGAGVSGLVAAYRLRDRFDLTVLEAGDHIGGHVNTIDVEEDGRTIPVDTGFIVFNRRNYPLFAALLDELGVESQPAPMSFGVRCERTGLEYAGSPDLRTLFAQPRNLVSTGFLRMIRDVLRFNREGASIAEGGTDERTIAEFLQQSSYSRRFVEHYLVPIGASLWSSPADDFRDFPIRFVCEFLHHHGMLRLRDRPEWRVIKGGSREYVRRLIEPFADAIRTRCPVAGVTRDDAGVALELASGETQRFDRLIIAAHADQALRLLRDPSPVETELLSAFPYQPNPTLLHTDDRVLPTAALARAAWNYHRRPGSDAAATVTYSMNRLQSLTAKRSYNVTLGGEDLIDPRSVIREIEYEHPRFIAGRDAAQERHDELIDHRRTSYCGAYWGYGFHEDGVASAMRVVKALRRKPAPSGAPA